MERTVYLNDEFLPEKHAHISVMDRGLLFGDGVYEVVPVYNKEPLRLKQHLKRLRAGLKAIHLELPVHFKKWQNILKELIHHNARLYGNNQAIYLQITRGIAPERSHLFPKEPKPTILAYSMPRKTLSRTELKRGKSAITLEDLRWNNCHIKSTALLANVLLYQQAHNLGAEEAILLRDGRVTEATTSNVFIVQRNMITTPPLNNHILSGVTRNLILELAQEHLIPCQEAIVTEEDLREANEIWITSSTREIYPITKLDGKRVGKGKPGPVWLKMMRLYHDYIKSMTK